MNPHKLCNNCAKYGTDFLDKLRIRYSRDKPHFAAKIKSLSSQIKINTFLNDTNKRKIRRCDNNIHNTV